MSDTTGRKAAGQDEAAHMRVLVACGYHDAATPYFAAERDIAHLAIPAELAGNIKFAYYEAGHMMYLRDEDLSKLKSNVATFLDSASKPQ